MVFKLLNFCFCVIPIFSLEIIKYNFATNFGQVFYDFSDNHNYAVNGISSETLTQDTTPTDRGAYFQIDNYDLITLPPNDITSNSIILENIFTIGM